MKRYRGRSLFERKSDIEHQYNYRPTSHHNVERIMNTRLLIIFSIIICANWFAEACEPDQGQSGCKIIGASCSCGYGCKTEYIYRTRRACLSVLRERSSNVCFRIPCIRGICLQTAQDPGFTCKCEGTGFYGQRCEKACPTMPMRGLVYPHECVVI